MYRKVTFQLTFIKRYKNKERVGIFISLYWKQGTFVCHKNCIVFLKDNRIYKNKKQYSFENRKLNVKESENLKSFFIFNAMRTEIIKWKF